ncbi:hypothetical protein [Nostoc sp. 106C]|uniref:hypothetical protein n=1 Tax=Nostoc sp. 106C TaxID=1932667 RepID=UPI000A39EA06|nr:hypothetical protein [Nostoc sp. 106C]OUL28782.1 hypothetical protein BV375_16830 [Nostoc sp. 106C]
MFCQNAKKGKITVKANNTTQEIEITTIPFNISCSANGVCGQSGTRTITYYGANPSTNCINNTGESFSSFRDETLFFKAIPQASGTYDGNRYELWGKCPDGSERQISSIVSFNCGAITITSNTFTANLQSGLIVTDSLGNVLYSINVDKCDFSVSCDDDCPNGYCKIDCPSYPGYCCINEAKIKSLTNQLNS